MDKNEETDKEFEKDTLIKEESGYERYKNVTLYASWTKNSETPDQSKDTVKKIESTGNTKANIEFSKEINKNYKLEIKKVKVIEKLANKDVKFIADINVLDGKNVVKISNTKMKIRIAMPEELKGYNKYEVVYILNGEIKETLPATVENGYIVFETTHLSEYGIVAKKQVSIPENETNNPKTADNVMVNIILSVISIVAISTIAIVNKKNN